MQLQPTDLKQKAEQKLLACKGIKIHLPCWLFTIFSKWQIFSYEYL